MMLYDWNPPYEAPSRLPRVIELLPGRAPESEQVLWPPLAPDWQTWLTSLAQLPVQAVEWPGLEDPTGLPPGLEPLHPVGSTACLKRLARWRDRYGRPVGARWTYTHADELTELATWAARLELPLTVTVAHPAELSPLRLAALIRRGGELHIAGLHLHDGTGQVGPDGVLHLIRFSRRLRDESGITLELGWSGIDLYELAVPVALAAVEAGVEALYLSGLGTGPGGFTPTELTLANLALVADDYQFAPALAEHCAHTARLLGTLIPAGYPIFGRDAFRTATGVHAAAIRKALRQGLPELADRVYSGVPAGRFGRRQVLEVGPLSGRSNLLGWLEERSLVAAPDQVEGILAAAKAGTHTLSELQLYDLLVGF